MVQLPVAALSLSSLHTVPSPSSVSLSLLISVAQFILYTRNMSLPSFVSTLSTDGTVCTRVIIVVQILLGGGLHRMLKGAYNSGRC